MLRPITRFVTFAAFAVSVGLASPLAFAQGGTGVEESTKGQGATDKAGSGGGTTGSSSSGGGGSATTQGTGVEGSTKGQGATDKSGANESTGGTSGSGTPSR